MRPGRAMTVPRECEYNAGAAQRVPLPPAVYAHVVRSHAPLDGLCVCVVVQ